MRIDWTVDGWRVCGDEGDLVPTTEHVLVSGDLAINVPVVLVADFARKHGHVSCTGRLVVNEAATVEAL